MIFINRLSGPSRIGIPLLWSPGQERNNWHSVHQHPVSMVPKFEVVIPSTLIYYTFIYNLSLKLWFSVNPWCPLILMKHWQNLQPCSTLQKCKLMFIYKNPNGLTNLWLICTSNTNVSVLWDFTLKHNILLISMKVTQFL